MSKIYDVFPSLSSLSLNTTSRPSSSLRHLLPPSLQRIVLLSYPIRPASNISRQTQTQTQTLYGKGPADIAFTLFCALTFTLLRAIVMRYILGGFVRWYLNKKGGRAEPGWKGKKERKRREHVVQRFSEQGWSFLYCTYSWSLGTYILSLLPSPLSPQTLWSAYPHTPIPSLTKYYYLSQLGWWFHQIYVINTEKRRHDHWQMFSHHILTIFLVGGSYVMNFTRVGTVLHVLMDFCDILLPLAKMFRYLSFTTLCDATFVLFLVSWLITRQIGLAYIIHTCYVHAPIYIPYRWSPSTEHYMSKNILNGFIIMEVILLGLATTWFFMACRVAVRVIRGLGAEDSRSDDEEEEEVDEKAEGLHIEVGKDDSPTPSLRDSPSSSISDSWADPGTPKGVQAVSVGGSVPEVLKGLQCKRDDYKREELRRRK